MKPYSVCSLKNLIGQICMRKDTAPTLDISHDSTYKLGKGQCACVCAYFCIRLVAADRRPPLFEPPTDRLCPSGSMEPISHALQGGQWTFKPEGFVQKMQQDAEELMPDQILILKALQLNSMIGSETRH